MEIELKQKKCSKNVPSKFKIETRLNKMVFIFSLLNKATDVLTKRVNHFRQELTKNLGEVKIKIKENSLQTMQSPHSTYKFGSNCKNLIFLHFFVILIIES